ncbi:hypothetical protein EON65_15515 [archaeon]|nr:MAG: hypothetical protein EON65_15515 [archaeon]
MGKLQSEKMNRSHVRLSRGGKGTREVLQIEDDGYCCTSSYFGSLSVRPGGGLQAEDIVNN